jgi:dTDP-4-amino-4,6-dideoxygalactose transaminase
VGVASGTDALALALLALDVQPGDEVVTVSHTAGPTVAAIRMIGAVPVLIDVEPDTLCLDPAYLEDAYGSLCKAVIAVHLYGHPANMGPIIDFGRRHALAIVEDCAQAQEAVYNGHIVGTLGDSGCFSFYPTKNLGALGDGGLVSARDPQVIKRLRLLRTYGWSQPQFADLPFGRCSRLDEVQAAILSVKLSHLDAHVERRRAIAGRYSEAFADLPLTLPSERPGCRHVYHLYVVRTGRRDALAKHLEAAGIATGRHYPFPIHRQPGLAGTARVPRPLAVTEKSSEEVLSLPMFPSLSDEQQDQVIKAVRRFFARV